MKLFSCFTTKHLDRTFVRRWSMSTRFKHFGNGVKKPAEKVTPLKIKNLINIIHQPMYSTDLTPSDFFLFLESKHSLRGNPFQTTEYHT